MIQFLSEDDVREIFTMADAIGMVEDSLRARTEGRAADVPRATTRFPSGSLRVLPASSPEIGLVGYKATYSGNGKSSRGYLYLVDSGSGELRAIVESLHLSATRTGAASGVAAKLLARSDARRLALIGTGRQAFAQLQAVCMVRDIESVLVYSRNSERLQTFCTEAEVALSVRVCPARSVAEAVREADIINVITTSATPVLLGKDLAPGQHVNAAGSNALTRRELDEEAVRLCNPIVVDSRDVARSECGDLLPLVQRRELSWEALPELGEVLLGMASGRVSADQITLYESHGLGVQDLYSARIVLEKAMASPHDRRNRS